MANSLLDFVMSLVRDPDAAARYADNPEQAILDANLTDVTSADVSNLIPVVSESMSTAVPSAGADAIVGDMAGNVWASGAATAAFDAFDAFDDQVPVQGIDDASNLIVDYTDQQTLQSGLDVLSDAGVPDVIGTGDSPAQYDEPVIDDVPAVGASADELDDAIADMPDLNSGASGFDIF